MRQIIFATSNKDKVREIHEILGDMDVEILTMKEVGFTGEIEENGTTFQENARIKAKAVWDFLRAKLEYANAIVMADDSGLEIDALDKQPGVYSHRWLGNRTYRQAMEEVIAQLEGIPEEKRSARFVCAIAACTPEQGMISLQESCEGVVGHEIVGENGFGYDPFFYVPEYGCTTAQMSPEQKNAISHRGKALRSMGKRLKELL